MKKMGVGTRLSFQERDSCLTIITVKDKCLRNIMLAVKMMRMKESTEAGDSQHHQRMHGKLELLL